MLVPPSAAPAVYDRPRLITGPQKLVAVVTFYPIASETKSGKSKPRLPLPQENEIRSIFNSVIMALVAIISRAVKARSLAGLAQAVRTALWLKNKPSKEIAGWRSHGEEIGREWLAARQAPPPLLKWAHLTIVCYYPDYKIRDVHGLSEKEAIDGLSDAGFFINDAGIVSVTYGKGGVDTANPRYEFWVYELELAAEDEALLEKPAPKSRKKAA